MLVACGADDETDSVSNDAVADATQHAAIDGPRDAARDASGDVRGDTTLDASFESVAPDADAAPSGPDAATELPAHDIGIWYRNWYSAEAHYRWIRGHGVGSSNQLLADVTGDGKADAVVFFASGPNAGSWYVAPSTGAEFPGYGQWATGFGVGSSTQFLADVTGDGMADAVAYYANAGEWWVAPSTGGAFGAWSKWIAGHGVGSDRQLMGDVTGDGKDDAIVYIADQGAWYVSVSTGAGFANWSQWIAGHGAGSSKQFVADVTGDGLADAVVFFDAANYAGDWYVSPSSGAGFAPYGQWAAGFGAGSSAQLVGDATGDGIADAVVFFHDGAQAGQWFVAGSTGGGFAVTGNATATDHGVVGGNGHGANADAALLGDVTGRGVADSVIFTAADGSWRTLRWDYWKPNRQNTWEAWNIEYVPRTLGAWRQYDSAEEPVIDEHLTQIAGTGIDFLLLDETNTLHVDGDYIFQRALAICRRIAARRAAGIASPRFAVGVGQIQYTHDPAAIESEASEVWDRFVMSSDCGGPDNYAHLHASPLLVVYSELADRRGWETWGGDKSSSGRFTLRWMQGVLGPTTVAGCGHADGVVPPSDYGLYYGWGTLDGAMTNSATMVAMPGWWNHWSCFTPRDAGGFYQANGWDRILAAAPEVAVINSYNEYAEETAIAPADSTSVAGKSERWVNGGGSLDPDLYWNLTVAACAQRKAQ